MASKKLYHDIDLVQNSILNAKLQPITSIQRLALIVGIEDEGMVVYDSTEDSLFMWTGLAWIRLLNTVDTTDLNYIHNQTTPSLTWIVNHNLNKYPAVNIVDSTGSEVEAEIVYISINQLEVRFTSLVSGQAYVN
jgi:hypothetical protein